MGAMRLRRRRLEEDDEDDGDEDQAQVVVLTSSDDEEANRDLSLEIVERARRRGEAKGPALGGGGGDAVVLEGSVTEIKRKKKKEREKSKETRGKVEVAAVDVEQRSEKKEKKNKKKKNRRKEEDWGVTNGEVVNLDVSEELVVLAEEDATLQEAVGSADSEVTDVNGVADNMVLRKLLRGRRYFDTEDSGWQHCHNCGEDGHFASNCTAEKRKRPCFVCGAFGHNSKQCLQAQECFVCKRRGHVAKDCPEKRGRGSAGLSFCLLCGDLGHEMSSCCNDYLPEDLAKIRCYVCKKIGHLCCANSLETIATDVSCYNCGWSGHSGVGCAVQRWQKNKDEQPSTCYVCGEEGHFARGCIKNLKSRRVDETHTPFTKNKKHTYTAATRSAPHHLTRPPYKEKPTRDWAAVGSSSFKSKSSQRNGLWDLSPGVGERHPQFPVSASSSRVDFRHRKFPTDYSGLKSCRYEAKGIRKMATPKRFENWEPY